MGHGESETLPAWAGERAEVLDRLAGLLADREPPHPLRVAVDGPGGDGWYRTAALFGSREAVRERYVARYLPGQELYRVQARPLDRADVVLDLADPLRPAVRHWPD
ncbi:hypothetical protein [Actinopolymorpha rutila]|uniref:Uncharacterized protein n=1 Tax=Actinopolymorpha rutila TaxID=446787 RepID=A0A852ZSL6_9ACTN|nr:hypothetical protein [Actinopolymorpha rutila]NYH91990.1 hypothetical protein [Actinopolymorpha rutila]